MTPASSNVCVRNRTVSAGFSCSSHHSRSISQYQAFFISSTGWSKTYISHSSKLRFLSCLSISSYRITKKAGQCNPQPPPPRRAGHLPQLRQGEFGRHIKRWVVVFGGGREGAGYGSDY